MLFNILRLIGEFLTAKTYTTPNINSAEVETPGTTPAVLGRSGFWVVLANGKP